jgi:hypothetical protein
MGQVLALARGRPLSPRFTTQFLLALLVQKYEY